MFPISPLSSRKRDGMKIIEQLSNMVEDELDDSEKYARKALECKEERRELANLFFELSNEEMNHMNRLHTEVVKIIDEYRKKDGEPPAPMLAVYEYLHKKHIDHASKIKAMQSLYK